MLKYLAFVIVYFVTVVSVTANVILYYNLRGTQEEVAFGSGYVTLEPEGTVIELRLVEIDSAYSQKKFLCGDLTTLGGHQGRIPPEGQPQFLVSSGFTSGRVISILPTR